jgi:type II secretory ATPase GspE/PulE/Tfp pilus assembly ATPase PilB-like protein/ActR/RegA family two-component response regulator
MSVKLPLIKFLQLRGFCPGSISEQTLEMAAEGPVRTLAKLCGVEEGLLCRKVAESLGVMYLDLEDPEIRERFQTRAIGAEIPEEFCFRERVAPLYLDDNCITVATANPLDLEPVKYLASLVNRSPRVVIAEEIKILRVLGEYFQPPTEHLDQLLEVGGESVEVLAGAQDDSEIDTGGELPPIIKLCNRIILGAVVESASDIHIEPLQFAVEVRYRLDGIMRTRLEIPKRLQQHVISRMKLLSGMDIAEKRKTQDGRFRVRVRGEAIDIRASVVPVAHGETVVLRLLRSDSQNVSLENLGMGEAVEKQFRRALRQRGKILFVTGPTGSGKTTTLYSGLKSVNDGTKKIITVENPVEYRIPGISQIQVNEAAAVTFASALRSILRQDPDIIMVGEIRDHETAEIAIQAAETGHLVLATLHTNDAPSAIARLAGLGIDPHFIANCVTGILAQRLVRKVCQECKTEFPFPDDPDLRGAMRHYKLPYQNVKRGMGCATCGYSGFKGRVGFFSYLEISESVHGLIRTGAGAREIERAAEKDGNYDSLELAALKLMLEGRTGWEEIRDFIEHREIVSTSHGVPREAVSYQSAEPRVLIVEDNEELRTTLSMLLSRERYEVETAANGEEALSKVSEEAPQIVLCDLRMPVMDGQEFLVQMKSRPDTRNIPVVMLTASDDEANEITLLNLGASDFISKSCTPRVISTRLRRALSSR